MQAFSIKEIKTCDGSFVFSVRKATKTLLILENTTFFYVDFIWQNIGKTKTIVKT